MKPHSITTVARCCCCRQLLPPRIWFGGNRQRVWDRIVTAHRPPTSQELFDELYGHDSDGGPLYGVCLIHQYVNAINKKLIRAGLLVQISGARAGYKLVEIERDELMRRQRWQTHAAENVRKKRKQLAKTRTSELPCGS